MTDRLLLDERIVSDGTSVRTYASLAGAASVRIEDEGGSSGELSVAALDKVMTRYGRPLEDDVQVTGDALACGDGHTLRRFRFHAVVDAEGRDYLVWERPQGEPLAVLATHVTAALRYLVLRLGDER